jgi:hypothetical protein
MLLIISAAAIAQEAPQNVVKVNPLGILFGNASLAYERALTEKSSIVVAPSFGFFSLAGAKYSSYGIGAEYRFYLSKTKTAPEGLYASPGLGYTGGSVKIDDGFGGKNKTTFGAFYGKGVIGNQWIWDSGFSLDLNGGIQYTSFSYKDKSSSFSGLKASGILPALGLSIGYAF